MSQGEHVNILLLEDDPAHAEAVRWAFLDSGTKAKVRVARTVREYWVLAAAQSPDIAIADLNLSDGSGMDVLTSPSEAGRFPILIMTGFGDERVAVEAMKAGAIDYVEKSSEAFAAMPRTVERVLREWNLLQKRERAEEALRKSESQLRALSLELAFIEERERKRLALYLHDEIGQSLALLRMKFGSLTSSWGSKFRKQNIQQIRDLLEKVIDQTHALTFELSPPVLHQLGLEAAIEWAGEKISQDFGIEFKFSDDGMIKPLSADTKTLLFRCVRELMSNTAKHAKAKRMTVSLKRTQNQFAVVVEDNGLGFDTSLPERQQDLVGFGLLSVREHLGAVGGSHEFHSEPGRGTRITLSVPLKEEMPSS